MIEHREEYIDLCAGYALGSLDEADRKRLEQHLDAGCETCEQALADFSAATVLLASSAPAARPSPALRDRVLRVVEGTRQGVEVAEPTDGRRRVIELEPRRGRPWMNWGLALAAAAFAITSAIFWGDASRLRTELDATRGKITDLSAKLEDQQRLNEVLSAPGARVAVLEMTQAGVEALRARATYDPASRSAVLVFENFKAPSGHDYELWAIRGAAPASLGVIKTDESGRAVVRLENVGDPATLNAFAVSLEAAGGSPNKAAPSGPVVMLGKLSG